MKRIYFIIFSCLYLTTIHAMDAEKETLSTFKQKIGREVYTLLTSSSRWDRISGMQSICNSQAFRETASKTLHFIEAINNDLYYRGKISTLLLQKNGDECWEGLFIVDNTPAFGPSLILGRTKAPSAEEYKLMKIPFGALTQEQIKN